MWCCCCRCLAVSVFFFDQYPLTAGISCAGTTWAGMHRFYGALWQRMSSRYWRRLLPQEHIFVRTIFGDGMGAWLAGHVRLGQRRLGDTRRALSLNGGWLSFPAAMFEAGGMRQSLRLSDPVVAGIVAHELLHVLQRRQKQPVTRQALLLQCQWLLQGRDPYSYSNCSSAAGQLRQFWRASVEQQGQMWQDCVQAQVAGQPLASHALLAVAVRAGRLRQRMGKR